MPADACGLRETARVARYLAGESAGQCGPCIFGLAAVAGEIEGIAEGRPADLGKLRRWLGHVDGRGACSHPDGAVRLIRSSLDLFVVELEQHARGWCCGTRSVLPVPARKRGRERAGRLRVNPIACDGRGLCAELLPELITIDDWGFPIIAGGDVPARLQGEPGETVRACPKLALRLEERR